MQKLFFTPGPSQLYPTVHDHLMTAVDENIMSISHRSLKFQQLFSETVSTLRQLLRIPSEHQVFFLSSATEAWERVIMNCVERECYHFINGAFSRKFAASAEQLHRKVLKHEVDDGKGFDTSRVDIPDSSELVGFVQNETATGVAVDMSQIYYVRKNFPEKLIAVDIVSSAPQVDIDYDYTDCVFFSVQKGFGLPAGLGVLIVSPRAMEKADYLERRGISTGSYHSLKTLSAFAQKHQTPETPNVMAIYLLRKVMDDMLKKGLETIRQETLDKAVRLQEYFINKDMFHMFVNDESSRSPTVTVIEVEGGSQGLIGSLIDRNVVIGAGYGAMKPTHIRIANFPAHSMADMETLITALDEVTAQMATA